MYDPTDGRNVMNDTLKEGAVWTNRGSAKVGPPMEPKPTRR
jgi:hypothetical protein